MPQNGSKRALANENERRRMESINKGFEHLKMTIPSIAHTKSSKAMILQQAAIYVNELKCRLGKVNDENARLLSILASASSIQRDVNNCDNVSALTVPTATSSSLPGVDGHNFATVVATVAASTALTNAGIPLVSNECREFMASSTPVSSKPSSPVPLRSTKRRRRAESAPALVGSARASSLGLLVAGLLKPNPMTPVSSPPDLVSCAEVDEDCDDTINDDDDDGVEFGNDDVRLNVMLPPSTSPGDPTLVPAPEDEESSAPWGSDLFVMSSSNTAELSSLKIPELRRRCSDDVIASRMPQMSLCPLSPSPHTIDETSLYGADCFGVDLMRGAHDPFLSSEDFGTHDYYIPVAPH